MESGSTPEARDPYANIQPPTIAEQELHLQQLVQQGVITPEEAQTVLLQQSDLNNISLDPNLKKNQMDALAGLQDIADSGGMTAMDRANLAKIQSQEDTAARGKREAILQNAASRGLAGSGLELMNNMINQQESATRQSQRDLDVAGTAQQRALEALMQQGQLAGTIQNQDFNQQAKIADANDAIAKFNAQNQQGQINKNVEARNNAQASNLALKQAVSNANAATNNQQQQYNKELLQKQFNNQITKAGGQAGVDARNQQAAGSNSQAQADAWNKTIGTGISAGASIFGKKDGGIVGGDPADFDSQPRMLQPGEMVIRKEDVPEMLVKAHTDHKGKFDAAAFLDSVTGHKYGYKKGKKNAV